MKLLSKLFMCFGLLWVSIGAYYLWLQDDPNRLAFTNYSYHGSIHDNIDQIPNRIIIKDQRIDIPVYPSRVTNNIWETTINGASYLASSPIPGSDGNSIIYAHNWASLFGPLVGIKPGEKVEVDFPNHTKKFFVVEYTSRVSSAESTILAPSKDKRITLYTCTGFLDSKRFVAVAILE